MITLDEYEAHIRSNAVYYGVSLFLGSGRHDAHTCRTLEEAREVGQKMVEHYRNGRKPLIYAIDAQGSATLVTE
jgi:hypothetical protein